MAQGTERRTSIDSFDKDKAKKSDIDLSHLSVGQTLVSVDPRYFRPTEVDFLLGDPTKAEEKLGWSREYNLQDLVNDMMKSDIKLMRKDQYLKDGGYQIMSYFE